MPVRITDKLSPSPDTPGISAATVADTTLGASIPCVSTPDTTKGAECDLVTTHNSIVPGAVQTGKRSLWALEAVQVDDGGPDSDGDTPGNNAAFMTQGIFVP